MKILALSTNYRYHQDVLQSLYDKGIVATHVVSHAPDSEKTTCSFYAKHNTTLINGQNFYQIKTMQKMVPADAPALSKEVLDYFVEVERDFYTISDRYAYFSKSFRTRKRLFRYAIRYWLDFFAKNEIDGLFAICSPHNFPDYLAFHTAKYLGIKTLMTTDVMINDHILLLDDYRQVFKVPEDFMAKKSNEEIISSINPVLYNKAFSESREIAFTKLLNDKTLGLKNVNIKPTKQPGLKKLIRYKKRLVKYLTLTMFKPRFKATFAMNGEFSDFSRRLFRLQSGIRLKRLKNAYEKLAVYPDYDNKFVYFAMHLNPERTSQPEAEVFEDHLLAIEILARSVPNDWVVYVKENPSQYGKKLNIVNGKHYRDASDYTDYTRLPNVKLMRQDVKTADLIKNATIVSTLKGTVGWETIGSGKGAVIFSNSWYSACRAAYRVDDVDSCKKAIASVLEKKSDEIFTDKLKFLAYMQDKIVIGSMGGHHNIEIASEPYENLVESLADNLKKRFAA